MLLKFIKFRIYFILFINVCMYLLVICFDIKFFFNKIKLRYVYFYNFEIKFKVYLIIDSL